MPLRQYCAFIVLVFLGMLLSGVIFISSNQMSCKQAVIDRIFPLLQYNQPSVLSGRTDVVPISSWLAPIIWDGTFDPKLIDSIYIPHNIKIVTTVFALGKYTRFLQDFLESAEEHYFSGYRVHYYLFTDQPEAVPSVKMNENHTLTVRKVPSLDRWQDISMGRMEILENLIANELIHEADYMFCLDVDTKFYGRWGAESLGHLVGVIHPWFFDYPRDSFSYERRPESQAFIPAGEGDYYYTAAAFGGVLEEVYRLTKTCHEQLRVDRENNIEAVWHEESHLNKYFLYNKPTKLLSPEYLWRDINASAGQIKVFVISDGEPQVQDVAFSSCPVEEIHLLTPLLSLLRIMRLRQSVHFSHLAMFVGLLLSGLMFLSYTSYWFRYTRFLQDFLESAEEHYFSGYRVHYYLFTDQPEAVPSVKMNENHTLTVRKVPSLDRWQDISMGRMEILENLIANELIHEADYMFCLDVDTKFYGRWGAESLGHLVGVIHPWFFDYPRDSFSYERRPESQAFIPAGEGDYYYTAAAFGGVLEEVYRLTKTCHEQLRVDRENNIEAVWHEESHLNKYFLYNKPTKLLSPEYLWRDINASAGQIKVVRFSHVAKNNAEVRPNL
ncbi:hypothetical protein DNTS_008865 [Danionella cerebrum]|uniref:Globoside alpha-1,3-N-acetylgalactosaminyltransferase 1 n=1 Tax=Danionella cerebrum TaxID=2873325 RepID=A0A553R3Q2_9TELE|nr:hypothetical protein DNTS_008865 [Danionella translucida]